MFESTVRAELADLNRRLGSLRAEPGVEIFAMRDSYLDLSIELSYSLDLTPFDQAVLASVLGRAREMRVHEGELEMVFCEKDSDLQPWDKDGNRRHALCDMYDELGIWVYGDFDMQWPPKPEDWPRGSGG